MNGTIRRNLMEAEYFPRSIEQLYKRVMNLDKHWRESRRKEKMLRKRRKIEALAQRINTLANTGGV